MKNRLGEGVWSSFCLLAVGVAATGCAAAPGDGVTTHDDYESLGTVRSMLTSCQWGGGDYVRVGDFNGYGADILSPDGAGIDVFRTIGSGRFDFQRAILGRHWWGGSDYTFVGDFNGDGRADLASASGGTVYIHTYNGSIWRTLFWSVTNAWGGGALTFANWPASPTSGAGSGHTFAADFTGDGVTDLASASGNQVYMHRVINKSQFSNDVWPAAVPWGAGGYTFAADFTGDGKADIATANGGTIYLLASTGGGFVVYASAVANSWGSAAFTFAADFNNDGKADIASASGGNVYMKLSTGTGFTSETWTVANLWAGGDGYTFVEDFNADGRVDIASANGTSIHMKLGRVGGGFDSRTWTVPGTWGGAGYTRVGRFVSQSGYPSIVTASGCTIINYQSTGSGFTTITS